MYVFIELRNCAAKSSSKTTAIIQPKSHGFTSLTAATIYEPLLGTRFSPQVSVSVSRDLLMSSLRVVNSSSGIEPRQSLHAR